MTWKSGFAAILWCWLSCAGLVAEDEGADSPQLGLVVVRLQDEQPPEVDLPPTIVEPAETVEPGSEDFEPFVSSPNFPSLTDQTIGELESGLRGAPLSVFDNPRAIEIITQQQLIEKTPIDMGQALEQSAGVMVQRTGRGQSSPFVRGLTGQQVLVMVDGVRMTNATFRAGPNQYFNTIDPNMVERIEVIRGPGSVLYGGDALGGVINVVTKRANYTGYNYVTGGTIQRFSTADLGYTGRVDVEGWVGSAGVFAGAGYGNYNNVDIGGNPDAPPGFVAGRQPASSWEYSSADIKLNYRLSDCSELVFGLQHYRGEDIFRTDRFPANRESIFDPQVRDLYFVRWQGYDLCGAVNSYQITASLHRFDETRADRDFRQGRNPSLTSFRGFVDEQFGLTGSFLTEMDCCGTLSYGFDWYHDEISSSRTDVDASLNPAAVTTRGGEVPDDAYYSRYGVYLNWDVWLTDRLLASSGVRFEHVEAGATVTANNVSGRIDPEYQDWIGHVGLSYEVNPCLHLVGSISEGFRAPNIDDLATTNGNVFVGTQLPNPNLIPETSITYEAGAKWNSSKLRGQAFVWWSDLQNHILRGPPDPNGFLERANGDSRLQGVEFSGEYLLDCEWSVYGNFWYTYGQDVGLFQEPLDRIPPTQGIVGLRRRWNRGDSWFDVYAWLVDRQDRLSARDIADVNRIPPGGTPGYATVNFRYGRLISDRQRVSVNLQNLFDTQYRVHGSGSDGPGIGATITYEILR